MTAPITISYVLPVHNEEKLLRSTALAVVARIGDYPGSELILVENGSSDSSPELVDELAAGLSGRAVKVIASRSAKGVGHAVRSGIDLCSGDLVVLTGADLPFGFSDLDQVLALEDRPSLVIGSKGHPGSDRMPGTVRPVMSWGFRWLTRATLGIRVRDSQGSILIEGSLARRLCRNLTSTDYLVSTEIVAMATSAGVEPLEVPVRHRNIARSSSVRPVRDSVRMAWGLLQLRRRLQPHAG